MTEMSATDGINLQRKSIKNEFTNIFLSCLWLEIFVQMLLFFKNKSETYWFTTVRYHSYNAAITNNKK